MSIDMQWRTMTKSQSREAADAYDLVSGMTALIAPIPIVKEKSGRLCRTNSDAGSSFWIFCMTWMDYSLL